MTTSRKQYLQKITKLASRDTHDRTGVPVFFENGDPNAEPVQCHLKTFFGALPQEDLAQLAICAEETIQSGGGFFERPASLAHLDQVARGEMPGILTKIGLAKKSNSFHIHSGSMVAWFVENRPDILEAARHSCPQDPLIETPNPDATCCHSPAE